MSGNGCSCEGSPAPAAAPAAATPCGSGAQYTELVWETLALPASSTVVSPPFPTHGANAFDFVAVTIFGASLQTSVQAQVSDDGVNWSNAGSPLQITAVGYSASSAITGNSFAQVRFVGIESGGNPSILSLIARFFCG
ncbi:MAG: hypothetical protein FD180_3278 [Planctomycetota bacterium]|nr:MAG: hypothetical protein FD180_3278 [Planctomycetota bacterium]